LLVVLGLILFWLFSIELPSWIAFLNHFLSTQACEASGGFSFSVCSLLNSFMDLAFSAISGLFKLVGLFGAFLALRVLYQTSFMDLPFLEFLGLLDFWVISCSVCSLLNFLHGFGRFQPFLVLLSLSDVWWL